MKQTLLQILTDSTNVVTSGKFDFTNSTNYWMWAALIEMGLIAFLIYKLLKRKKTAFDNVGSEVLNEAKNSNVDMDNLMNSINKSRTLYKQLSSKCHPDRFPTDVIKQQNADLLFQEITKNQRNYNKLLELKEKAQQQLNITI